MALDRLTQITSSGISSDSTITVSSIAGIITATNATVIGELTGNTANFSGDISGTTASFSGNVSVAGTLTYEDVTNVDSIGVITARSGVIGNLAGDVNSSGISTFSQLNVGAGGTIITTTAGGSVGVGTDDPQRVAHIFGSASSGTNLLVETPSTNNDSAGIKLKPSSGNEYEIQSVVSTAANSASSFIVYDRTNDAYRMIIDSSGRVTMPYQPCFQASGNQSATYASQVVPFNVSLANNGGHYSTSTYRFTAPVAGYYFFTLHAILGPTGASQALCSIRKNGQVIASMHRNSAPSDIYWEQGACSAVIYLAVSDYVDAYISDGTIYVGNNITGSVPVYSALNGHLIG